RRARSTCSRTSAARSASRTTARRSRTTSTSAMRCSMPRAWPACRVRRSASRRRCASATPARRRSSRRACSASGNSSPNWRDLSSWAQRRTCFPSRKQILRSAQNDLLKIGVVEMKAPVRVAVTGAAGQIGYALLFRIASGEMLGKDQPVILQMLELPLDKAQAALRGVMMELEDCAFPLLAGMVGTDDAEVAFKDADYALLVGARPRGPGMERKDLLLENAKIFTAQGAALNKVASRNVKVLVVGNPANPNAYIAMKSAPDLPAKNFTAMLRLDHNRALSQLAGKAGVAVGDIEKLVVWGNHSPTMYPDYRFATAKGESLKDRINDAG